MIKENQALHSKHSPLKLGFIGGGITSAIGESHRIAAQMDGLFTLTAGVFSSDHETSTHSAEKYLCETVNDIDALLKLKLDVISVLSPSHLHYAHTKKIINHPTAAIVIEKPAALSSIEIQNLQKSNTNIYITYNYTGFPMLRELQARLASNEYGKTLRLSIHMPQDGYIRNTAQNLQSWRTEENLNLPHIYYDLGSHAVHLMNFLGHQAINTFAQQLTYQNHIGSVSAMGETDRGAQYELHVDKISTAVRNGLAIEVQCEFGRLYWGLADFEHLYINKHDEMPQKWDRGHTNLLEAGKTRYQRFKPGHPAGFLEAFANYYADIHNAIQSKAHHNQKSPFVYGLDDAYRGMKFLEAMHQSAQSNQMIFLTES